MGCRVIWLFSRLIFELTDEHFGTANSREQGAYGVHRSKYICGIKHGIQLQPREVSRGDDNGAPGSRQHGSRQKAAGSRRNIKRTILPMKEGGATAADNNSNNNWLLLLRHMSSWRGENFSSLASAKKQYVYGKSSKTFVAFCLSFDGVQIEIEFRYGLNRAQSANLSPLSLALLVLPAHCTLQQTQKCAAKSKQIARRKRA